MAPSLPPGRGYVDLGVTYGRRGVAVTLGVMKQSTGSVRSGWHVYGGAGVGSAGLSAALTVSRDAVSPGWNLALGHSSGRAMWQAGLDAGGTPFTEAGVGGPRGTTLVAYHAWSLPTVAAITGFEDVLGTVHGGGGRARRTGAAFTRALTDRTPRG